MTWYYTLNVQKKGCTVTGKSFLTPTISVCLSVNLYSSMRGFNLHKAWAHCYISFSIERGFKPSLSSLICWRRGKLGDLGNTPVSPQTHPHPSGGEREREIRERSYFIKIEYDPLFPCCECELILKLMVKSLLSPTSI